MIIKLTSCCTPCIGLISVSRYISCVKYNSCSIVVSLLTFQYIYLYFAGSYETWPILINCAYHKIWTGTHDIYKLTTNTPPPPPNTQTTQITESKSNKNTWERQVQTRIQIHTEEDREIRTCQRQTDTYCHIATATQTPLHCHRHTDRHCHTDRMTGITTRTDTGREIQRPRYTGTHSKSQ